MHGPNSAVPGHAAVPTHTCSIATHNMTCGGLKIKILVYSTARSSNVDARRSIRGSSRVLGTNSVPTFIWKPNCTPIDAINHAACHANSGIRTRDDRAKFNFFVGREDSRAASSATVEMYCILELLKLSSIILVGKFA